MLSLAKTYKVDDLMTWADEKNILGTYKIDGVSLSLIYKNHTLVLAKTRGNGKVGEDVTDKARWVSSCLPSVDKDILNDVSNFEVRGELFCSQEQFSRLVEEMRTLGLETPSSSRNIVAGILGRKQHTELARYFGFFVFDLIWDSRDQVVKTEEDKFNILQKLNFDLPAYKILKNKQAITDFLEQTQDYIENGSIAIDGAVFSYNDLSLHAKLGYTSHHPRYKMSFKWQGETATSKIYDILWNTSRLGIVTPVAVIETVNLSGANISNVTLHNAANVMNFNLKPGDVIELVRSGEVIPKFLRVVEEGSGQCQLPKKCQSCEHQLVFDEVRLICENPEWPAQKLGGILNWIKSIGIDDLSEKRLEALIKNNLVSEFSDLYKLELEDLLSLPLTKEKMAKKLLANIEKSKRPSLPQFLSGLGIKGVGATSWELLLNSYPTLEELQKLSVEQICDIKGFALKTAEVIVCGLKVKNHDIQKLLKLGICPHWDPHKKSDKFSHKTFVITGTFSTPRKKIIQAIEDAGGKVQSAVSSNTSVLLIADVQSNSSKAKKARELKIPMWNEQDFFNSLEDSF